MAELTAVVGTQVRPDMVSAAVMPESYLTMMVTADKAVVPLNIDSSGFVIDANKNFVIDYSGNKLWNMFEPDTLDANNPYIIAQDSSGVLAAFPNFLATQGYITPSESSSPVAINNLANNIQDMQLPALSAAQNPNVNQGVAASPQNNNMLYIGAAVVLLLLLRR